MRPSQLTWGWAFSTVGRPGVAQRVWPIPHVGGACGIRGVGGTRRFHEGTARGIISAVLETLEPCHEKLRRSVDSGVSNDSAHKEPLRSMNNGATF